MRYDDADPVMSVTGGRQGCKLGGIVFGAIYAQAIKRVRARLFDAGLHLRLICDRNRPPWCAADACEGEDVDEQHCADIVDVTFVDDEALMVTAGTPAALTKAVTELLEVVTEIFLDFGLSLNWKRGKSEMMLQFIGKRAVRQLERLRQSDGTLAFPLPERCAGSVLHIVDSYKDLGGFVSSDGTALLDARYRADTARTAYVSLVSFVFSAL